MRTRGGTAIGGLLVAEFLVLGIVAVLAPLLVNGFGPQDDDWAAWDWQSRELVAATVRGSAAVLSAVSLLAGARWLLGRRAGWEAVPMAHLGAAVALGASGSAALGGVLLLTAAGWLVLLGLGYRPTATPTPPAGARPTAEYPHPGGWTGVG